MLTKREVAAALDVPINRVQQHGQAQLYVVARSSNAFFRIYVSYLTPIIILSSYDGIALVRNEPFSKTTARHRNKIIAATRQSWGLYHEPRYVPVDIFIPTAKLALDYVRR